MCEIVFELKNVFIKLCQNIVFIAVRFFETDRQVATVVMETVQLVLSQFKSFQRTVVNGELNKNIISKKIISKCCEFVKLCHITRSGTFF